jgi:Ca2+-binding EF-hand superfamily protein
VSPKQFRQTLNNLGFTMSDEEMTAVQSIYGTDNNEIKYLEFINDGTPFKTFEKQMEELNMTKKDQYIGKERTFVGEREITELMFKLKAQVKKDRIRLREFFQDHDPLRKGHVIKQKFRGVLHTQKISLTNEEYENLENYYSVPSDDTKVNYIDFNEAIENIFTYKDLEKNPLKKTQEFHAPSILDPKNVLSSQEEEILDECMQRLGWFVRHKRLLIKPFFQDKDKSKSGFVANTRFRSIFDNMKLQITDEEYKIIFKRFQAKADDEVNYVEFDFVLRSYSGDHDPI